MDRWAAAHPSLAGRMLPIVPRLPGAESASHDRITSWCFFGQTDWCRRIGAIAGVRLPIPSHDTYVWYCAAVLGANYRRINMKRFGWDHMTRWRLRQLKDAWMSGP